MKRYLILLLLLGSFASGCVKQHVALTPEDANKIQSTAVVLVVSQEELEAEIVRSNMAGAMGGGLLFALADAAIENSRSKSAEEQVSPLRSHLSDIDYRRELIAELQKRFEGSGIRVTNIEATSALTTAEKKKMFDNRAENSVLIVNANYKLTPNFKQLKTSANAELLLEGNSKPIYKNMVLIHSDAIDADNGDQAVMRWSEDNGTPLRQAVRDGIRKLSDSIAKDLNPRAEAVAQNISE